MDTSVFTGWEIFAGSARLTKAHSKLGCRMRDPVDLRYQRDVFDHSIDRAIRRGEVNWLWLAPPGESFSKLRNLDRAGPLRPKGTPAGDPSHPEVALGNRLWRRALELAELMHDYGGYVTLEHPLHSKAWQLPQTRRLADSGNFWFVQADWCAYSSMSRPNRKPMQFLTTMPWLNSACLRCPGNHIHGKPLRGKRAAKTATYPWGFCRAVAASFQQWWHGAA